MLAIEQGDDIVVVDAGLMFPDEEMLGIDLVIPDITYLRENKAKVRGIILTHAHEDHMGALPYVLRDLPDVPIFGTKLTLGLMRTKLREHKLADKVNATEITPGTPFKVGPFACDSYYVCHSIPDAVGLTIETRYGTIVHSGDWKFDHTPVDGKQTDFARLSEIAAKGVLLLLSDSTRAEVAGYTQSERHVGDLLDSIMSRAPGRVITTTFASNISRIKQIVDVAAAWGRRTAIIGRSMENYTRTARELGYLTFPEGALIQPKEIDKLPDHELCIITTGSQGEPTSALSRMALGDHRHVAVKDGDTVVMSATPIPGNEELVEPHRRQPLQARRGGHLRRRRAAARFRTREPGGAEAAPQHPATEVLHPGPRRVPDARAPRAHRDRPRRGSGERVRHHQRRLARDR